MVDGDRAELEIAVLRRRIAALQGNLVLSAQGDLSLHDSYAKGEVKVDAQGKVTLTGQSIAEADIRVSAPSGLANRGAVQAAGQLLIAAPSITNAGSLVQRGTGDFVKGTQYYEFESLHWTRTPFEILLVMKLRQKLGLQNPDLDHPLLGERLDVHAGEPAFE